MDKNELIMLANNIKSKGDAEDFAIQWQDWQSSQTLDYEEVAKWQNYFEALATEFDLKEEFKENGLI